MREASSVASLRQARLYAKTCREGASGLNEFRRPESVPMRLQHISWLLELRMISAEQANLSLQPSHTRVFCDACRWLPVMAISDFFQIALQRLGASASTVPTATDWAQVSLIIGATCAISLPIGLKTSKHMRPCASPGQCFCHCPIEAHVHQRSSLISGQHGGVTYHWGYLRYPALH